MSEFDRKNSNGKGFNGKGFTGSVILTVILFMLVFGSTDIENLSEVELDLE